MTFPKISSQLFLQNILCLASP